MSIDYPYPQVHMVDWMDGVEWERERIIKLLEITNLPCCNCMQDSEFIFKLIKGENK